MTDGDPASSSSRASILWVMQPINPLVPPFDEVRFQLQWTSVGDFTASPVKAPSALEPAPGVYRLLFLDSGGYERDVYYGETRNLRLRIGKQHLRSTRVGPWIHGTIEHGGTVNVAVLTGCRHVTERGKLDLRLEVRLVRLAIEGSAVVLAADATRPLTVVNVDHVVNDDVPPALRRVVPWWERDDLPAG